jgi:hypothetical protein
MSEKYVITMLILTMILIFAAGIISFLFESISLIVYIVLYAIIITIAIISIIKSRKDL